ncbi:MAG: DUF1847 domain-containing protein [Clostridiales bacterium]|nr:DUF1847 domain-containing protein [Clostridiales bacterium]
MSEEIRRSCIDCGATRCDNHSTDRPYPAFCVSRSLTPAQRDRSVEQYLTDEEDRKLAQVAASIESDGYKKWPRVQETILFAKRMGYHKIGIATCVALLRESRILAKMLRANGFSVYGVACKTGEVLKDDLDIPPHHQGPGPVACNPVLQAQRLNEEGTELNIVMGLCVGHDSLFYKHAKAVTTTLVVKDRVLVHNPVMALYTAEGYYAHLMKPLPDEEGTLPAEPVDGPGPR